MRKLILLLLLTVLATGCIGPPFLGDSDIFFAYRSGPIKGCLEDPDHPQRQYYGDCEYHPYPAVDFLLPEGKPIRAVESGFVYIVGDTVDGEDPELFNCSTGEPEEATIEVTPQPWCRQPDKFVVLDHRAGQHSDYTPPEFTRYSHLGGFNVSEGQWVKQGSVIGWSSGEGGRPHLHFDAFQGLRDNTPTGGFNTYAHQADYGIMEWCRPDGSWAIGGIDTFVRGTTVQFRRC